MKARRNFVSKEQDTKFSGDQSWGIRIANPSTLSSNILDNDKAQKAIQIIKAKRLNDPNKVAVDKKKQNQLLEVKNSIGKDQSSAIDARNHSPFEITPKTKKKTRLLVIFGGNSCGNSRELSNSR